MLLSRRLFIHNVSALSGGMLMAPFNLFSNNVCEFQQSFPAREKFGKNFVWGAASAAFQTEGAAYSDGRSASVWDTFASKKGKIKNGDNALVACDFYNRYTTDIALLGQMNFNAFRFSLSWPRIIPNGIGNVNLKGTDFYNRLIDTCLEKNIEPWLTLYHWDLPQVLEDKGGWTNRDILDWFGEYCTTAAKKFGDRVKNWIVLNEPMAFTSFGYLLGLHAPGKRGLHNFMPALHHAALCQAIGSRIVKDILPGANVGSTFSCSLVEAADDKQKNTDAANRLDAALNRLFIEPALGMGYPEDTLPFLKRLDKYMKPGDGQLLKANFDFVGIQYYFRVVAKHSGLPPLYAGQVKPNKRGAITNTMGLEVFPEGIGQMLQKFSGYKNIPKIYITESGACFDDILNNNGTISDNKRTGYHKETLFHLLKTKNKGIAVDGFFVWSLTDNFEWNYGYKPRFGLVYIDYATQNRFMKDSGKWFSEFLSEK
ncbi:MAG: beta-glucosidase [Bacteroidales bacterium]|nr:beta-glucosidase [Bacteroidales bacterium]